MKRFNFCLLLLCVIMGIFGCSDKDTIADMSNVNGQGNYSEKKMLEFDSPEQLFAAINSVQTRGVDIIDLSNFTSLLDEIDMNDPLIADFTEEEKQVIKENHLSYYEVFELEDYFPNENFARLINTDGEICVMDTIYKVTEKGTLVTQKTHRYELELTYYQIRDKELFKEGEEVIQLNNNVKVINTFHVGGEGNGTPSNEQEERIIDDEHSSDLPPVGGSGNNSSTSAGESNTPLEIIPWSTFDTFSAGYKTFVGKLWSKVFGDRSTKHQEIGNGYRVNGSLYDYNYGVYHECGAFVSMSKKRGGFFKFINGWKDVEADELVMDWSPVILELDYKIPSSPSVPTKGTSIIGYDPKCHLLGENKKCFTILSFDITEEQIYQLVGQGLKKLIKELNKKSNSSIDENIEALKIVTSSKIYTVVKPTTKWKHNRKKYREVFDSGVRFVITNRLFTAPTSVKTWADLYNTLKDIPQKDIKNGSVRLAGRIGDKWGGMIIKKD